MLTTLYNHAAGRNLINDYLAAKTPYSSCGMMIVDLDYFKNVNDTYGHLFGDKVLFEFSRLLLSCFGNEDIIIMAGGDEFVIFLKDIAHSALIPGRRPISLYRAMPRQLFIPPCTARANISAPSLMLSVRASVIGAKSI
ncbi:MAG: GGDEF domain-containing protein [Eubacteriales bacterium]|nr:GGDEF domain-containing protein [Eubacteriales bacterium]